MPLPTGRPVRFLQVNMFYPQYLRDFYATRPALQSATFQAQIDALLDDGFSGPHILPVTICAGAVIGAGAVVTSDIAQPGIYAGNPARLLRRL